MDLIERQKWFVNRRLGLFIHFNSATCQFKAGETLDWEFDHENKGAPRTRPFDPADWKPAALDCRQWARAARSLGATIAALTAKHHEGFCLWPTATTGHCVKNASVKTDVVESYLRAFREAGVEPGLYFSMLDLTRGIGRARCDSADVDYTKAQLTELLTCYGKIPFIIFDGWQAHWGGPSYANMPYEEIRGLVKSLQPDCLVLNISCESDLAHTEAVFYENAAGQEVDGWFEGPGAACNILGGSWFWRASDPSMELKDAAWALRTIEGMNDRNITFILNAPPNVEGVIDANFLGRFEEIGRSFRRPQDLERIPEGWLRVPPTPPTSTPPPQ